MVVVGTAAGVAPATVFGGLVAVATLGFLAAYLLVCLAAPRFLTRIGELTGGIVVVSVLASAALVATVVELGRTLGMDVVAEGVETIGQMAALRAMNCTYLQGWLIGHPVPVEELGLVCERMTVAVPGAGGLGFAAGVAARFSASAGGSVTASASFGVGASGSFAAGAAASVGGGVLFGGGL